MVETLIALVLGNPMIIAIFGGVVAVAAAFLKGRKSGKNTERLKQKIRDEKTREYNDATIDKADAARRAAGADDGLYDDDGYRAD